MMALIIFRFSQLRYCKWSGFISATKEIGELFLIIALNNSQEVGWFPESRFMNFSVIRKLKFWSNLSLWGISSRNTFFCLVGCSIGDLGTILFFQLNSIYWPTLLIMALAVINGLLTSIIFETVILSFQMTFKEAINLAIKMSFLSMIAMEIAMNTTDFILVGGAQLNWKVLPYVLLAGFLTPLPYNYYQLNLYGKSCH